MPSPRLSAKLARLLGGQMLVVIAGLVVLWAFILYNTRPNSPPSTGGSSEAVDVSSLV